MSRGLGRLQRAIVDEVREGGSSVSFGELCWRLAMREGRITPTAPVGPLAGGFVAGAFYQGLTRAVAGLAGKELRLDKRKFHGVREFCMLYPFRSPRAEVKGLRERLLPMVERYLDETGESQFSAGEVETHYIARVPPETLREAGSRWRELYGSVVDAVAQAGDSAAGRLLFAIAVRGEELFGGSGASHRRPLSGLLREYEEKHPLKDVIANVQSLLDSVFPAADRGHSNLKRRLYAIADFSKSRRRPGLKPEFERWLLREASVFLEQLPGHRTPPEPRVPGAVSFRSFTPETGAVISPIVADLLGRDALGPVKFLSPG